MTKENKKKEDEEKMGRDLEKEKSSVLDRFNYECEGNNQKCPTGGVLGRRYNYENH